MMLQVSKVRNTKQRATQKVRKHIPFAIYEGSAYTMSARVRIRKKCEHIPRSGRKLFPRGVFFKCHSARGKLVGRSTTPRRTPAAYTETVEGRRTASPRCPAGMEEKEEEQRQQGWKRQGSTTRAVVLTAAIGRPRGSP